MHAFVKDFDNVTQATDIGFHTSDTGLVRVRVVQQCAKLQLLFL